MHISIEHLLVFLYAACGVEYAVIILLTYIFLTEKSDDNKTKYGILFYAMYGQLYTWLCL